MGDASISFSGPMVCAILAGHKTVTRRICKPAQEASFSSIVRFDENYFCRGEGVAPLFANPYGKSGDRLWVKEAWRTLSALDDKTPAQIADASLDSGYCKPWAPVQYEADGQRVFWASMPGRPGELTAGRYRHARFMPRWASRLALALIDVKAERLHDISADACKAEGIQPDQPEEGTNQIAALRSAYAALWDSLNGDGSWDGNPWVWVVAFERV